MRNFLVLCCVLWLAAYGGMARYFYEQAASIRVSGSAADMALQGRPFHQRAINQRQDAH